MTELERLCDRLMAFDRMDRICRGGGRLDVLEESYELLKQLRAENARLREALKTLFEGRGLSYNAAGEASCNWCERWDKDGLGEEYIEHLSGCPFAALSAPADASAMED